MERRTTLDEAKYIMGSNFIGKEELSQITSSFPLVIPNIIPNIPFSKEFLIERRDDYLLILGISEMKNGKMTLKSLRDYFGINPDFSEPCFYNQDWYMHEQFMERQLENKWFLLHKNVFQESRAVMPSILETKYLFPSAILCAYSFFAYWFYNSKSLWEHDFVWCADIDHNGDRIYVGKYRDIEKLNKNGFSIHRHLSLRSTYGATTHY